MKPVLVILAAGIGSRYGGLKQIEPVGPLDEAIIDYSVFDAIKAGFGKIFFVVRDEMHESFNAFIGNKYSHKIEIEFAVQEDPANINSNRKKPWGTGHAVLSASELIDTPFAVINADDFYGREAFEQAELFLTSEKREIGAYAMIGYPLGMTLSDHGSVSRGHCEVNENGYLTGIIELGEIWKEGKLIIYKNGQNSKKVLMPDSLVSMNFWCFMPDVFSHFRSQFGYFLEDHSNSNSEEFLIPHMINKLVHAGQVTVKILEAPGPWFGITYKEDKPGVEIVLKELVESNIYPSPLWK
ncbi:MAG: nucleotidyltransferase [Bacteroidetes bacterium]|nr:nucleotidyltransferase [Bacteroidota bacterium]MCH8233500.1 nucleotidyltransferase [Bacteroidota bacterium]